MSTLNLEQYKNLCLKDNRHFSIVLMGSSPKFYRHKMFDGTVKFFKNFMEFEAVNFNIDILYLLRK